MIEGAFKSVERADKTSGSGSPTATGLARVPGGGADETEDPEKRRNRAPEAMEG